MNLNEALEVKDLFLTKGVNYITLERNNPYFYELQAQMFHSNLIRRPSDYFYPCDTLPEFVTRRVEYGNN